MTVLKLKAKQDQQGMVYNEIIEVIEWGGED